MNTHEIERMLEEIASAIDLKDTRTDEEYYINFPSRRCKSTRMGGSQVILFGLGKHSRCWDSDPSIASRYHRINLPRLRKGHDR